jgi:MFS family permease
MGAFVVIGGGLPASMIGGFLGDRFESKIGGIKSYISGVGALCALPFILVTYALQPPFWIAIFSYYIAYFIGEMWYGPAHAQINNMFPSEYQGFCVAVFNFSGAIAGTIATTVLGIVTANINKKNASITDPIEKQIAQGTVDGRVLACGVAISYLTCAPLFICSGLEYAKGLNKIKTAAVVRGTLKRASSLNRTEETPRT